MKIEFRMLQALQAAPLRTGIERVGGDHVYAPLSLPHLLARRIELRPARRPEERRYGWKRDDESVN